MVPHSLTYWDSNLCYISLYLVLHPHTDSLHFVAMDWRMCDAGSAPQSHTFCCKESRNSRPTRHRQLLDNKKTKRTVKIDIHVS